MASLESPPHAHKSDTHQLRRYEIQSQPLPGPDGVHEGGAREGEPQTPVEAQKLLRNLLEVTIIQKTVFFTVGLSSDDLLKFPLMQPSRASPQAN